MSQIAILNVIFYSMQPIFYIFNFLKLYNDINSEAKSCILRTKGHNLFQMTF